MADDDNRDRFVHGDADQVDVKLPDGSYASLANLWERWQKGERFDVVTRPEDEEEEGADAAFDAAHRAFFRRRKRRR